VIILVFHGDQQDLAADPKKQQLMFISEDVQIQTGVIIPFVKFLDEN
jgi:hypothetical protein